MDNLLQTNPRCKRDQASPRRAAPIIPPQALQLTRNRSDLHHPAERFAEVSSQLGLRITRVVRYRPRIRNLYWLQVNGHLIYFGGIANLDSQTRFRRRLLDQVSVYIPRFTRREWHHLLVALFSMIEEVSDVRAA